MLEAAGLMTVFSVLYPSLALVAPINSGFFKGWSNDAILAWVVVVAIVPFFLVIQVALHKIKSLKRNSTEDWMKIIGVILAVVTIGVGMLSLSTQVTQSQCVEPKTVNVTSSNCKTIQTVSVQDVGPLGFYGTLGKLVILLTLAGVVIFTVWSAVFYVLFYGKQGDDYYP